MISKEVKRKALSATFNLITVQVGCFSPESLDRRDVLMLQADPPARELEKFFALGTETPRLRRDDKFGSRCSACLRRSSRLP